MTVIPIAYFGPISWWTILNNFVDVEFDIHENYIKQTMRNHCNILTANGKLTLSIPVKKVNGNHTLLKDVRIESNQPWQKIHSRTVMSAYKASPFYDYFIDDISPIWEKHYNFLIDTCFDSIEIIGKILKIQRNYTVSQKYIAPQPPILDLRKESDYNNYVQKNLELPTYHQVFCDRFDFVNDLSILDKIFNE
ncbi:MAG: WbqC family protein [Bacteroidales bacterium]|nr:WbqC family protein [Bacteroidales bacterium]